MKKSIFFLRFIHGLFTLYFILCLFVLYQTIFTLKLDIYFFIAISSLLFEGLAVFILNKGDCPLIHIQRRIGDNVPFFNLFLPKATAKKAVPFLTFVAIFGMVILITRLFLNSV